MTDLCEIHAAEGIRFSFHLTRISLSCEAGYQTDRENIKMAIIFSFGISQMDKLERTHL